MHRPAHRSTHAGGGEGTKRPRESDGASDPERVVRQNTTMVVSADDVKGLLRHEWGVKRRNEVPPLRVRVMTVEEIRGKGERRSCIVVKPDAAVALHPAVSVIGAKAFWNLRMKGTLELPTGLTKIGDHAFQDCYGFSGALTIPEGVVEIGRHAFSRSGYFTSLTLPPGLTTIENSAFSGCDFEGALKIPEKITSIKDHAFFSGHFSSLDFGRTPALTEIGESAFSYCSNLEGPLTIPAGVTKISEFAFFRTFRLKSIKIAIPRDRPLEIQKQSFDPEE